METAGAERMNKYDEWWRKVPGRGDKWEAYYVQSAGYRGRLPKRRRVGGVFDTATEAARAYAVEARAMLKQEVSHAYGIHIIRCAMISRVKLYARSL